jgi:hypothetical protein
MYLTLDDAIAMYARACRAWYGKKAVSVIMKTATECRQRGDLEGEVVWGRVAESIPTIGEPLYRNEFR